MSAAAEAQAMPDGLYSSAERRRRILAILAASSGNLVEWFDFYIYAFCAIYFASAFFPKSDPTAQLMDPAGVFAAGFLMRPLGGWLFGRMADRVGRKTSLVFSVTLMCAGSLVIGVGLAYAIANAAFGGTAEYVALGLKSIGRQGQFAWYVTIMMLVVFLVSLRLPREGRYLHHDR